MLKVPRTIPSRCTIRGGGGSSITVAGADAASPGALVTVSAGGGAAVGVSTGAATTGGAASATVVAFVAGSGVAVATDVAGDSCFRYCAATKAYASAGGSICSHSPFAPTSLTASPCFKVPSTL